MFESSLSRVLLPAPFGPIRPTTSPRSISSETSRSAQRSSLWSSAWRCDEGVDGTNRAKWGAQHMLQAFGEEAHLPLGRPSRYCLPTCSIRMAGIAAMCA